MQSTIPLQGATEKSVVPLSIKCIDRGQDYSSDIAKLCNLVTLRVELKLHLSCSQMLLGFALPWDHVVRKALLVSRKHIQRDFLRRSRV